MGDVLAFQYGGSEAHNKFFQQQRGNWQATMQSRDLVTSIRRFYSNTVTDAEKQHAMNLFLGNFVPEHGKPALWELESDIYLHAGLLHALLLFYILFSSCCLAIVRRRACASPPRVA
jgi:phosphatidylinositol 3,5-bisphosphate 5-phosphatase